MVFAQIEKAREKMKALYKHKKSGDKSWRRVSLQFINPPDEPLTRQTKGG